MKFVCSYACLFVSKITQELFDSHEGMSCLKLQLDFVLKRSKVKVIQRSKSIFLAITPEKIKIEWSNWCCFGQH